MAVVAVVAVVFVVERSGGQERGDEQRRSTTRITALTSIPHSMGRLCSSRSFAVATKMARFRTARFLFVLFFYIPLLLVARFFVCARGSRFVLCPTGSVPRPVYALLFWKNVQRPSHELNSRLFKQDGSPLSFLFAKVAPKVFLFFRSILLVPHSDGVCFFCARGKSGAAAFRDPALVDGDNKLIVAGFPIFTGRSKAKVSMCVRREKNKKQTGLVSPTFFYCALPTATVESR